VNYPFNTGFSWSCRFATLTLLWHVGGMTRHDQVNKLK